MSYRFVRITNFYKEYIKDFYYRNENVSDYSYDKQYQLLIKDSIENSSSYVNNFKKIGVTAFEIITNAEALQNAWKKEHHVPYNISNNELVIEQLKFYQPDVIWLDDISLLTKEWKDKLLKKVPSVKLFVGHHCAPYGSELLERLKLFDILFTCTPGLKNEFEKFGLKTQLLYHGFESSVLNYINEDNQFKTNDFVFTGSLITGGGFHKSRIEYIESILKSGINLTIYGNLESLNKIRAKKVFYYLINFLKKLGLKSIIKNVSILKKNEAFGDSKIKMYSKKLIENTKSPVFGKEMYQLLSKSNICFNIHGDVAGNCAGNIRLFEATGVGSCLVTDWKENITDLFEPGKEIITYKTKEECIEKVKWLIDNPEERKKIAAAGQKRTLSDHSIKKRAEFLNELFLNELKIKQ